MTTVAILGTGAVGCALATRLLAVDVPVRFGSRNPETRAGELTGPLAEVPTLAPADAVANADVVILAVPSEVAVESVRSAGDLGGAILVDTTNPLQWEGVVEWAPPAEGSVAQELAAAFPGLRVIKGFCHFGAGIMEDPRLANGRADALFAGDDAEAKQKLLDLARHMGFQPYDAGPLKNAAALENLAVLWIHLARTTSLGRGFAFQVVRRG